MITSRTRARRTRTRWGASAVSGLAAVVGALGTVVGLSGLAPGASAATGGSWPVTVKAANGSVVVPARPTRIISLSPTATDMLFSIGAGSQVVAVDEDSTYPADAPRTSLSGLTPNVEAIAKYRPDLVVVSYDPNGFVASLAELHIPVIDQVAADDLAQSYGEIDQLGEVTGHAAAASTVVASMRSRIAKAIASAPRFSPPLSYYYELDPTGYYSATSNTFIGELLGKFGLVDIADGAKGAASGYPQLSEEYVLAKDPDVVFLADTVCCGQSAETVAARPGWRAERAVENRAVIGLNDSVASQWGPQIAMLATDIADALAKLPYHHAT